MSLDGILILNKPRGWTSFQAVAWVRRRTGLRRAGHTGTLDPAAQGVLPICLGAATRLAEYIQALPKVYRGELCLGAATDTYDATGHVTATGDPSALTEEALRATLGEFLGRIQQRPPPFSALKRGGQPLYRYARAGNPIAPAPRPVAIYRLELLAFQPPSLTLEVECGQGTYIRSLAHDLGQRLGCGAHLKELLRSRVGPFTLEGALTPAELEEAFRRGSWPALVQPPDAALGPWPAARLSPQEELLVRRGQAIALDSLQEQDGQLCRAYSSTGRLLAVLRYRSAGGGLWQPVKVLAPPEDTPGDLRSPGGSEEAQAKGKPGQP